MLLTFDPFCKLDNYSSGRRLLHDSFFPGIKLNKHCSPSTCSSETALPSDHGIHTRALSRTPSQQQWNSVIHEWNVRSHKKKRKVLKPQCSKMVLYIVSGRNHLPWERSMSSWGKSFWSTKNWIGRSDTSLPWEVALKRDNKRSCHHFISFACHPEPHGFLPFAPEIDFITWCTLGWEREEWEHLR